MANFLAGIFAVLFAFLLPGTSAYILLFKKIDDIFDFILVSFLLSIIINVIVFIILGSSKQMMLITGGITFIGVMAVYFIIELGILILIFTSKG